MNLDNLKLFQTIVEKGSLAAAGRELRLSATTVSERLAALEAHYGVTLLNRTTRVISLTEEGRTLLDGSRHLLTEAKELEDRLLYGVQTLSGQIRVSAPFDLGSSIIEPIISKFIDENPQITIELLLSDGYVNIVDEGIDIAVRFGNIEDSTLRVRTIGQNRRVVCASPEYIAMYGKPIHPKDLIEHNCLLGRFGTELDNVWRFKAGGKDQQINVSGNRITNDGRLRHDWCLAGYGVALKSIWEVGADLESGTLVSLLEKYSPEPTNVQLLFPPSRSQPLRVGTFADYLTNAFRK